MNAWIIQKCTFWLNYQIMFLQRIFIYTRLPVENNYIFLFSTQPTRHLNYFFSKVTINCVEHGIVPFSALYPAVPTILRRDALTQSFYNKPCLSIYPSSNTKTWNKRLAIEYS